jgi:hypothetical protein
MNGPNKLATVNTDSYKVDGVLYEMEYWQVNPYVWECRVKDTEYDTLYIFRTTVHDVINSEQARYRCWIGFSHELQRRAKRLGIVSSSIYVQFTTLDILLLQEAGKEK